ncbi:MAG TPA: hypothetical protein VKU00_22605, partial [Chthonomonadaceae bacterium]|nr:hypothetical protein [Chthonomonadaceae bacterium]
MDAREARREAARLLGQARTERKAAACRENGKKGGRPKGEAKQGPPLLNGKASPSANLAEGCGNLPQAATNLVEAAGKSRKAEEAKARNRLVNMRRLLPCQHAPMLLRREAGH